MNEFNYIGVSGYKGSGKDTFSDLLASNLRNLGVRVERESFAAGFKDPVQRMFQFSYDQVYGDKKEEVDPFWNVAPRHVLQTLGTEWGREMIDPDIWVKVLQRKCDMRYTVNTYIVISDVRFTNEVQFIQRNSGILINVVRDNPEFEKGDTHQSEVDLKDFNDYDYIVHNNASLAKLDTTARGIARRIYESQNEK